MTEDDARIVAEAIGRTRAELERRIERLEYQLALERRLSRLEARAGDAVLDVDAPVIDLPSLRVVEGGR